LTLQNHADFLHVWLQCWAIWFNGFLHVWFNASIIWYFRLPEMPCETWFASSMFCSVLNWDCCLSFIFSTCYVHNV
jgi:hypothetical protein